MALEVAALCAVAAVRATEAASRITCGGLYGSRNQRSNAMQYDRWVVAGLPAACRSFRYAATGATSTPAGSTSRYGSHGSPVSISDPDRSTTSSLRSRGRSSISAMGSDRDHPSLNLSGEGRELSR
ncbi:MAG: hypothetical protein JWN00_5370 [Actinomycetia bacterium]|nr:hypothetical protein [Actinomycetes bacterium]